jgi:hypothetical protein
MKLLAITVAGIAVAPETALRTNPQASGPGAARAPLVREDGREDGREGGALPALAARYESDAVPAAGRMRAIETPQGDVLIEAAHEDPFFLGFAGGSYYPPEEERVDPLLAAGLRASYEDGRPAQETYAFVMFGKRITPARVAELENAGARVLGFHPQSCVKVALAPVAVDAVAALDFVRWIGVPRASQKVHPVLANALANAGEPLQLYVSVHDSDLCAASAFTPIGTSGAGGPEGMVEPRRDDDVAGFRCTSNGWQQRALEQLGADVGEYDDRLRTFRVRAAQAAVELIVSRDFVLFVEQDLGDTLDHDESTPMVHADYGRASYDGDTNLAAIAGVIDSGTDYQHQMLNHVWYRWVDYTGEGDGTLDTCGHGSHTSGTVFGLPPSASEGFTGNAPRLGWGATGRIRTTKYMDAACSNSGGTSVATRLASLESSYTDGSGSVSPRPHVINCSFSTDGIGPPGWVGTETDPRAVDAATWDHDQLFVFSAGNEGSGESTLGEESSAKNALTVANVVDYESTAGDPGSVWTSSSRGPCGDDRWKPNVAAPGRWIRSASAETTSLYVDKSGTSMAAPHVTGVAAQLVDHYSWLRYAPHRIKSLLMATALTHDDVTLSAPSTDFTHHLNTYGTGLVNAAKAHYAWSDSDWTNWTVTLSSGSWTFADFTVPAGCTRLVVCMHYEEDAASAGASAALVNDLDLWIDSPSGGIDPAGNTGEYFAQQSPRDNTEIRILNNPSPTGTWRWKVWPDSTTSSTRVSVTVVTISADTTPDGTLNLTADDVYVQPSDDVVITASAYNPEYFASCIFLETTSAGDALQASTTTLDDGVITDLTSNQTSGRDVTLGSLRPGDTRSAEWTTRWATEGVKTWTVDARSDNWVDETDSVTIWVDGTPPGLVTNLTSSTHTANSWSNDTTITYTWTAATDAISGLDGYGIYTAASASMPGTTKDIEQVVSYAETLGEGSWYFNIRSVDNSGNWDDAYASTGPFKIDTTNPLGPSNLASSTHVANVPSCSTTVVMVWTGAADTGSGLAGYLGVWDTFPATNPVGATNIAAGSLGHAENIGSSASPRWFHLRAKDLAGNYGTTQHFGPVLANANTVSTYCTGKVNSLGCTPSVGWSNQPSKSAGNFTVMCSSVINNRFGVLFWGSAPTAAPFQGGTLCVNAPVVRTPIQDSGGTPPGVDDCSGTWSFIFDGAYMTAYGIDPGDTRYCQWWGRDPQSPSTTSLSNAIQFTVCE